MSSPPFKLKGVYVKKLEPKEISNYYQTRIGNIWKAAIGEKDESVYAMIYFSRKDTFIEVLETQEYCAEYSIREGELITLVDGCKNRSSIYADFETVVFKEDYVEFGDENRFFSGHIVEDIFYLGKTYKKSGQDFIEKYRYIPWS